MRVRGANRLALLLLPMLFVLVAAAPAVAQSETIEYYGLDALGSVRAIFDQQGNVIARMDYGPFGENLRAAIKFPTEQFAQLTRDAESGQDYAQARNYLPATGRFTRVDPVYAGLFSPQLWNRYAYSVNNPTSMRDPSGLYPDGYCAEFVSFCEPDFGGLDGVRGVGSGDLMGSIDDEGPQGGQPGTARPAGGLPTPPAPPPLFDPNPLPLPGLPEYDDCPAVPFTVTGVGPGQAPGVTAITRVQRADIPHGGVAIKPLNFGVARVSTENRDVFVQIELTADWNSAEKPNPRTLAVPRGLPSLGPYTPVDVIGPRSVRESPGNHIDIYNFAAMQDALASTRTVMVSARIPRNSVGVTCPR